MLSVTLISPCSNRICTFTLLDSSTPLIPTQPPSSPLYPSLPTHTAFSSSFFLFFLLPYFFLLLFLLSSSAVQALRLLPGPLIELSHMHSVSAKKEDLPTALARYRRHCGMTPTTLDCFALNYSIILYCATLICIILSLVVPPVLYSILQYCNALPLHHTIP